MMPDREKFIEALENAEVTDGVLTMSNQFRDLLVELLKEQEEQKRKWLQAIADTQLTVSPTGYETEEELTKRTGEWNGLQMAWDILTEGR